MNEDRNKKSNFLDRQKSVEQALAEATHHHNQGRFTEAERLYRSILNVDPNQPVALHLLGVLAQQANQSETALELISKAVSIKPDYFKAHSNLGNVLNEMNYFDRAVKCFHRAIEIEPKYAQAHGNLGNALRGLGQSGNSHCNCKTSTPTVTHHIYCMFLGRVAQSTTQVLL